MRRLAALTAAATLVGVLALAPVGQAIAVSPTLPPSGLVGWWPGDGDGTDIVNGNTAAPVGGGAGFVTPGHVGSDAFQLTVNADHFLVVTDPVLEPANVTVDAWVRRNGTPGGGNKYIVSKGGLGGVSPSYAIYSRGGPVLFLVFNPSFGFTNSPAIAAATVWDGDWHHVAGTYDGTTVRFYFDGAEVSAGTATPGGFTIGYGLATSNDLSFGTYLGAGGFGFTGDIDEVEIFDRALSLAEIQAIFDADTEGKVKEIVGDTDNEEIDISSVQVSDDGTDLSCMLFIATDSGLKNKSTFRCHFDFDDLENSDEAGKGCDLALDTDYSLGTNSLCTTSDITLTYRPTRRGGICTGLNSIICSQQGLDGDGVVIDLNDCDNDGEVFCKINITASLADLDAAWESECRTDDDCLTSATDKDNNVEYDVFMFFDTQIKGDRDRLPDTSPGTTKPDEEGEVAVETFPVPAP